jgi:formylglycine-generating enzyme
MRRTLLFLSLFFVVASCKDDPPPRPQYVVAIDTDAPVPEFGDRLLVEILADDGSLACTSCRQLFGVTRETTFPLTFGVLPEAFAVGQQAHVRARLYRTDHAGFDGLPADASHIDAIGKLPTIGGAGGPQGLTRVSMALHVDCFGVPAALSLAQTCDPASGELTTEPVLGPAATPKLATWEPARRTTCAFNVPPEMACIDGGAFLMGDVRLLTRSDLSRAVPERLVALSAYAMDKIEVTVGAFRALVNAGTVKDDFVLDKVSEASCTYLTKADGANDALPLNCVSAAGADAVCTALGKRLPTEAEWEFAAGARDEERLFSWGELEAACDLSAIGLARDTYEGFSEIDQSTQCRYPNAGLRRPWGPIPAGAAAERTPQGLKDMGGNVAEWVADGFAAYTASCWAGSRLFSNPQCPKAEFRSYRGGSWALPPGAAHPALRAATLPSTKRGDIGFRCAKSE